MKDKDKPLVVSNLVIIKNKDEKKYVMRVLKETRDSIRRDIRQNVFDSGNLYHSVKTSLKRIGQGEEYIATVYIDQAVAPYAKFILWGFWEGGREGGVSYTPPPEVWDWVYNHISLGLDTITYTGSTHRTQQVTRVLSMAMETNERTPGGRKKRKRVATFTNKRNYKVKRTNIQSFKSLYSLENTDPSIIFDSGIDEDLHVTDRLKIPSMIRNAMMGYNDRIYKKIDRIARAVWISLQQRGYSGVDFWTRHIDRFKRKLKPLQYKTNEARSKRKTIMATSLYEEMSDEFSAKDIALKKDQLMFLMESLPDHSKAVAESALRAWAMNTGVSVEMATELGKLVKRDLVDKIKSVLE